MKKGLEIRLIDSPEDSKFNKRRRLIKNAILSQSAYPDSHEIHSLEFCSSLCPVNHFGV
jgi:hypothetical protein